MIVNIGAKLDKIVEYIDTLSLTFPVYAGKPIKDIGKYAFFQLVSNSENVKNDYGVFVKTATFDFAFVADSKTAPDVELYEMLDEFSNKFCTVAYGQGFDISGFRIYSIDEGEQSGVMRENEKPYILAQYRIVYQCRY